MLQAKAESWKHCNHVSLAGGSGSGMVLPVLEYVRNEFGPEAMIWVMSVGAGHAERKESDIYNTTFIMSDILQSYYKEFTCQ